MAKTENQIERDFYRIINESQLSTIINGTVFRRGQRPDKADTEDCIIKFLGGDDSQIQTGTVILNIYIPYISYHDGRKGEDLNRIGEIEEAVNDIIPEIKDTDYNITTETTPRSYPEDEISQSIIAVRLKFKRLNQE